MSSKWFVGRRRAPAGLRLGPSAVQTTMARTTRRRMLQGGGLFCLLMVICGVMTPEARAASGDLDPTFNGSGYLMRDFAATFNSAGGVVVQPDGKIVVSGSATVNGGGGFLVTRYEPDGRPDPSFGTGGTATADFGDVAEASAVVLQRDGKLVVVGQAGTYRWFAVARYNPDGTPDRSFGDGGTVLTSFGDSQAFAAAVALRADGTIVVAGSSGSPDAYRFAVVRYRPHGPPAPT